MYLAVMISATAGSPERMKLSIIVSECGCRFVTILLKFIEIKPKIAGSNLPLRAPIKTGKK